MDGGGIPDGNRAVDKAVLKLSARVVLRVSVVYVVELDIYDVRVPALVRVMAGLCRAVM